MKIFKRILIVLAILILVITAIAFIFFPSKAHVERSVSIARSQERVFNYVNTLKNFDSWSPWKDLDTTAVVTYEGPESGVGAKMNWKSTHRDVGTGSMTYIEVVPSSVINVELDFGDNGKAKSGFKFEKDEVGTKMTWGFDMDCGANPLMRIMSSMMDKMIGKDYEKGLNKLKTIMESMPEAEIKVEVVPISDMHYLAVRDTATMEEIGPKLGMSYGMIGAVIKKQGLKMSGPVFAFYHNDGSNGTFIMDAAVPVDKPGKAAGKVVPGEIKAGHAVMSKFFGAYEKVGPTHAAIHEYIGMNNMKISGAPWEVYLTDPGVVKDTAQWETDVYYPIE